MAVPPEGSGCGVVCLTLFVASFVALAVYYLVTPFETPIYGLVAAVLWLAFVAFKTWSEIDSAGGLRAYAVATLGAFSSRWFAEAATEAGRTVIGFGYELFGRKFYYLRIDREWVVKVEMSLGQANWSVYLRYRDPAREQTAWEREHGIRGEVYVVGPTRTRKVTAGLFADFVAFLRAAGVELEQVGWEPEFRAKAT
jgi:hypothetical protein